MSSQRDALSDFEAELETRESPISISSALPIELRSDGDSRLVFLTDPGGLAVERYKILRRQLCALQPGGGIVLLTSPAPADGKTLTSINLAFSLAEQGHFTCLVDLDFRAPGVFPTLRHRSEAPDVIDILQEQSTIPEAIRRLGSRSLYLLGIREARQASTFQLDPEVVASFLLRLRATFAWVVLDLAPAIPFSDVSELLPSVDGALAVVRSGKTKKSLVGPTLEIVGNKLWGVILNDAEVSGGEYYGYYLRQSNKKDRNWRRK
jgi:Mrp family chromosome partitioning ATPase